MRGQKFEKIPLRHEGDEFADGRKMSEIRDRQIGRADLNAKAPHFAVREFQELIQQTQFVHQLERRRMDRVAAKIAQEIRVFFQHHDIDAGAREQEAEHHAGRTAANDATSGRKIFRIHEIALSPSVSGSIRDFAMIYPLSPGPE